MTQQRHAHRLANRSTRPLSTALAAAIACVAVVATAGPAQAAAESSGKREGKQVNLDWLEVGTLPGGVLGNAHIGYLGIDLLSTGDTYLWGNVVDFECPEGVLPGHGGGHGVDGGNAETARDFVSRITADDDGGGDDGGDKGPQCEVVAYRDIDGGDVTLVMDKRFTSARLTGTLNVSDHGTPLGNPPVNITLTGEGRSYRAADTSRWSDGRSSWFYSNNSTGRQSTVGGNIGPMIFDDAEGEYSNSSMSTFSSVWRERGGL